MSEENENAVELPPLTEKEAIFVAELTTHWNGAKAARAAGANVERARNIASEWRAKPHIAAHIDAHMKKRAEESKITAEALAEHLMRIVRADPRELIDYRIVNCRHCWGGGFRYQFTDGEMDVLLKEHAKPGAEKFDAKGGAGFKRSRDPNPDCTECNGEGEELITPKDTRDLSPDALALYAGVKKTKDGIQILMHDKMAAADRLARHFGMFVDRKVLENPDGSALTMAPILFIPAVKGGGDGSEA